MSRKDDLEQAIRESYAIIREYEAILRTSRYPEDKARARHSIDEKWKLIKGYLPEYCNLVGSSIPDDISQIAVHFRPLGPEDETMILVPAGEFSMGGNPKKDEYTRDWEQPEHILYLPDYWVAKTPITNAQYLAFVDAASYPPPEHWKGKEPSEEEENHPVINVSWYDAVAYCKWLTQSSGEPYRLPSEAEWEKAARGIDGRVYPWGNEWSAMRCNTREGGLGSITPVDTYLDGASPYGLLDMAGNVWEWTRSLWGKDSSEPVFKYPYDTEDGREAMEAGGSVLRVIRGGSFEYSRKYARCASRQKADPYKAWSCFGFRVCTTTWRR